jgi:acyl transferase domain-containing protein
VLQAVKSYMGHCETAAGIMGLIQPLSSLAKATSAKVLHLTVGGLYKLRFQLTHSA